MAQWGGIGLKWDYIDARGQGFRTYRNNDKFEETPDSFQVFV